MLRAQEDQFIQWLLTPKGERQPMTQEGLASELEVSPSKLTALKKDPEFIERWNAGYLSDIGSPEKKAKIMATLFRTATDEDDPKHVQAAEKYFAIEGSLRPSKNSVDVNVTARSASDLSDEELKRYLASKADDELSRRRDSA